MAERSTREWMEELNRAMSYRRTFGLEDSWGDTEAKFYSVAEGRDTGPNLVHSKGDTIVSALAVPEVFPMAAARRPEAQDAAPLAETLAAELLEQLRIHEEMEHVITCAYLFGRGFLKLGYDSEWGFEPSRAIGGLAGTLTQFDAKSGRMLESGIARPGMPWGRSALPHDVLVPWGTGPSLRSASWVAHRVVRHVDEIRDDVKYNSKRASVTPVLSMRDVLLGYSTPKKRAEDTDDSGAGVGEGGVPVDKSFVELYEIMDRATRQVLVIAAQGSEPPVLLRKATNALQLNNELPWVSLAIGHKTRAFWTTPPAFYLIPHQNETDDVALQAKLQRRIALVKLLIMKGALDEQQLEALRSGTTGAIVQVDPAAGVSLRDVVQYIGSNPNLNTLLHLEADQLESNAREAAGISRNFAGEFAPHSRTTAREVDRVNVGGEIRLGRKQMAVRQAYRDVVEGLMRIVAKHWGPTQAVRVVGADGVEHWQELQMEILQNSLLSFAVSFSTEHYDSPMMRQRTAMALYAQLAGDPRVNQDALLAELVASFNTPGLQRLKGGTQGAEVQLPMSGVRPPGGGVSDGGGQTS